jgi:hypothetical protein
MAQAHAITLGLDGSLNQSIRTWFTQFNYIPPIPLTAAKVDTDPGKTFERLLELMVASTHRNFILIVHGYHDGSGLAVPMTRNSSSGTGTDHTYLQRIMDLDTTGGKLTPKDRRIMGIGQADLDRMLALLHKVRAKNIDCVEFRACNLGRNTLSLDRFRQFFGARLTGAPDLHSFFGEGPAVGDPAVLQRHASGHNSGLSWETYNFPYALRSPDLVCCFGLTPDMKPRAGHVAADSAATIDAWIKKYIMPGASQTSRTLPIHGLWNTTRQIILEPEDVNTPLGGWGGPSLRRFIPPQSPNYAKHIIYSR